MSYKRIFKQDIYFLHIVGNKIVINDNYEGISVLDFDLNIIKTVKIVDNLTIYSAFDNGDSILLYCPDNDCIILLDLQSFDYYIFSLKEYLEILKKFEITDAHDFELDDNYIARISENKIEVFKDKTLATYYPLSEYTFLRSKMGIEHRKGNSKGFGRQPHFHP